jgi:hypothetical protein
MYNAKLLRIQTEAIIFVYCAAGDERAVDGDEKRKPSLSATASIYESERETASVPLSNLATQIIADGPLTFKVSNFRNWLFHVEDFCTVEVFYSVSAPRTKNSLMYKNPSLRCRHADKKK